MRYIHELPGWPNLTWDMQVLGTSLAEVRHKQGKHLGRMEGMGFDLRSEASLSAITEEIVKSSAIEGEKLNTAEVRSSVAQRLGIEVAGLPPAGRHVEGVVDMMLDATRNAGTQLTAERLFSWHAALFPTGRSGMLPITVGSWRDDAAGPMRVVSNLRGHERVHFQAPAASRLPQEMRGFLEWFNCDLPVDPVLKAGVAHLWFLTIHPFDDGNGRIARAIADLSLARADGSKERFYSMSAAIEAERKEYYLQLEAAQRGALDITPWLEWFLGCLGRALDSAQSLQAAVLHRARFWQWVQEKPVHERQRQVLGRMLELDWQGHLSNAKYAKLAKCSPDTALRDIRELVEHGILLRNEGAGRSTSYRLGTPQEA